MELTQGKGRLVSEKRGEAAELTCRVETDLSALAAMREAWDAFVGQAGGDIYFTYDWCRAWWRCYGRGRQLRVLLFRRGDQLVGLMPLVIDRLWLGPVCIRLAKLLGSDSTTVVLNPPVLAEQAAAVYARTLSYFLRDQKCDALWLGPLSGDRPHREQIRAGCDASRSFARLVQDRDMTVHTIFRLPETYEAYLASLGKSQRGMVRRERRTLEKQCEPVVELIEDPAHVMATFEEFLALHQRQWSAQNMLGHFGDMPRAESFNRELAGLMAQQRRVWLLRVQAGNRVVACEYAFVFDGTLYWRLPAREVGEAWERLSLGRVSMAYLIEKAIDEGLGSIEGGAGHYPYKCRMGAEELPVGAMLIAADRRGSVIKTRLLSAFSRVLHLLYYRIWFSRVAPKPAAAAPAAMVDLDSFKDMKRAMHDSSDMMSVYGKHGLAVRVVYLVAAGLWCLLRMVVCARRNAAHRAVVLCYHGVTADQREAFAWQMARIASRAADVAALPAGRLQRRRWLPSACVTFDDAFGNLLTNALPATRRLGVPVTIFAVAGDLGCKPRWAMPPGHPDAGEMTMTAVQLREAVAGGLCRIGSHTMTHAPLASSAPESVCRECAASKASLEKHLGTAIEDLALPYGSCSEQVLATARSHGYRRVYTLEPRVHLLGQAGAIGRFSMTPDVWRVEFLLTCAGGYTWLATWRRLVRWCRSMLRPGTRKEPSLA